MPSSVQVMVMMTQGCFDDGVSPPGVQITSSNGEALSGLSDDITTFLPGRLYRNRVPSSLCSENT